MGADIIVPKMGLTETHATVVRWRKAVGDEVSAGDVVVEIQADKADVDIEAAADGVITEILIEEGVEVELGTVIGRIGSAVAGGVGAPGPDGPTLERVPVAAMAAAAPVAAAVAASGVATVAAAAAGPVTATSVRSGGKLPSSPLARRVAAELGVALAGLVGTGPGGLVVARDVRGAAAVEVASPAPAAPAEVPPTVIAQPATVTAAPEPVASVAAAPAPAATPAAAAPAAEGLPELPGVGALRELELTRVRRVTARRLAAVTAIPVVTLHRSAAIDQARVAVAVARAQGVRATLTHAVLAACAVGLAKHPQLNGFWIDGRLYTAERINLGIAVDVEQGLLLAVAEDCGGKGIAEIAAASNHAVAEVRQGRGGRGSHPTFTVSNLGMLGIEQFTPVLNPPETGILGVGAVVNGRIGLSLTFDHRAIDGAPAARFLDVVARELAGA